MMRLRLDYEAFHMAGVDDDMGASMGKTSCQPSLEAGGIILHGGSLWNIPDYNESIPCQLAILLINWRFENEVYPTTVGTAQQSSVGRP